MFIVSKTRRAIISTPIYAPWPRERVSRSYPFQFVGLDYLGPINVKYESD